MKNLTKTQKLTISALCMALYLVVMMCTQSFAFGQYQVRIATALYGLSAIFPFLIIPFGLVNVLANTLMGGLGPLDMLGGGLVGIMTSLTIVYAKRHDLGNWAAERAALFRRKLPPIWIIITSQWTSKMKCWCLQNENWKRLMRNNSCHWIMFGFLFAI